MMPTGPSNKALYKRFIEEAFNRGNLEIIDQVIDGDYLAHDPSLSRLRGRDGARQIVIALRTAFADLHYEIDELIADGDWIAARWRISGHHTGPFLGIPATGWPVFAGGMSMNRFRDGRIVEGFIQWDATGLLRQLGVSCLTGPAPVNGTRLWFTSEGSGVPLLVIHGGLGFDHHYLRPWLDPLASIAQVIYYDQRGNGRSGRPASWAQLTVELLADDAEALLSHLGHKDAIVLGHSYGGYVAQELALRHPERVRALVLANTGPALGASSMARFGARATPEQAQLLAAPIADDEAMRRGMQLLLPLYFKRPNAAFAAQFDSETAFCANACNQGFVNLRTWSSAERLRQIAAPALIVAGSADWLYPPDDEGVQQMARTMPRAQLVTMADSGHFPFVEEKQRFLSAVEEFVSEVVEIG